MTFADRARAEAEDRLTQERNDRGRGTYEQRDAFVAGALWAVEQEPTEAEVEAAAEEIDRVFGWQHLRRYSPMTDPWVDPVRMDSVGGVQ